MERAPLFFSFIALPKAIGILELPKKLTVIRLRWLLVIICSSLLLSYQGTWLTTGWVQGFILFLILTNGALYFVPERIFEFSYFYSPLVIFDTLLVTASLVMSGQVETDFYLAYFLIIILCALLVDFRRLMAFAALTTLLYGYFLFATAEVYNQSIYLRIPFLFVSSLFYGYFAQVVRIEKALKAEAEQEARDVSMFLAEANRLKSEYLTNTSHELRTPVAAIIGYGHLLLDETFGSLTPQQEKALERLIVNARGLLGLVDALLDYSKLEKGEASLYTRQQEVGPLLDQLQKELAPLEEKRPYRVQYKIEEGIPPIETDWGKLKNVLVNLLSNAIKFTDEGEVKLSVVNGSSKKEVSFVVSDTGIGIPKNQISLIFDKFRQVDGSPARHFEGAGLGLAISKNLVDLLGGEIEVESAVGKGSTFKVTIPITTS